MVYFPVSCRHPNSSETEVRGARTLSSKSTHVILINILHQTKPPVSTLLQWAYSAPTFHRLAIWSCEIGSVAQEGARAWAEESGALGSWPEHHHWRAVWPGTNQWSLPSLHLLICEMEITLSCFTEMLEVNEILYIKHSYTLTHSNMCVCVCMALYVR